VAGSDAIAVAAPAKLNLYLHITGRRADGYHLLDSLIAFADIHDTLIAEPAEELSLTVEGPFAGLLADEADNLVLRAAHALADTADLAPTGRLTLVKRLPVAAGIGGGSADAAAAIRALCALWGIAPAHHHLLDIALGLGADVPVCLEGVAARIGGIGELMTRAPRLPAPPLVLVNPGVAVSTPAVFKARRGAFSEAEPVMDEVGDVASLVRALEARRNDLAEPALSLAPEIGDCLGALAAEEGCLLARMSGSGATCFGLFADDGAARRAAASILERNGSWWVRAGRLLSDTASLKAERP
jgi:4-diphosphocytidyl-2-C-methyl-D-erythritol kinase